MPATLISWRALASLQRLGVPRARALTALHDRLELDGVSLGQGGAMRVGLIGWYGHRNAGDDRILHCLTRALAGHEIVDTGGYTDAWHRRAELNRCDLVVLGGGGLVLRGANRHARLLEQLRPPLVCLGISVESNHADNRGFIALLEDKAELIWLRDAESLSAFEAGAKAFRGPDLTFLDPFPVAPATASETCALNLRPWMFWRAEFGGRRHALMSRLLKRIPSLARAYPFERWRPETVVRELEATPFRVVPLPLYGEPGQPNDVELLARFFPTTPTEFDPSVLRECRYLVAMRLHALIFASQMGIPFVSLSYAPKCHRFCASAGMADYSVDLFQLATLSELFCRIRDDATAIRDRLLDFRHSERAEARRLMRRVCKQHELV